MLPQRERQVSRVGESGQRQMKRSVDLVSWMVTENRRTCCGHGRVFLPSSYCTSVYKMFVEEPPIVMWGSRDHIGS